jgi:hypothetical protein
MPIINYTFENRIFFAQETGDISPEDARTWAEKLKESADQSPAPIVAFVDALEVKQVSLPALDIFSKASFTRGVLAVVVATNIKTELTARNIGLLGKRKQTMVFGSLAEAREYALILLEETNPTSKLPQTSI